MRARCSTRTAAFSIRVGWHRDRRTQHAEMQAQNRLGQCEAASDLLRGRPEYLGCNAAVVAERDVENPGHFRVAGYCAKRRSVSSCFFIAARRSRRCSSGVPGRPDFISGFSVVFVGALGACGFIADTLLHPGFTPPAIRAGERTRGPVLHPDNRQQPDSAERRSDLRRPLRSL